MKQPPTNVSRLAPTGTAVIAWREWRSGLLGLLVATAGAVSSPALAQTTSTPVQFPAASDYLLALDDPNDCNQANFAYRDIDKVYVFDDVANQRIFVKYVTYGNAGWPKGGKGIYKWAIDTAGQQAAYRGGASGTHFEDAEYVLYVWDNGFEDEIGEMNLVDVGLDQSDKDAVQLKTPADIGPHTACGNDCVGTLTDTNGNGDADLGEPQIANNNPDIGYRLSGNEVEMYVSYSAIGGVSGLFDLCLVGVGETTATNYNLDQAARCDNTINAVGTSTEGGVFCGTAPGALTIVKDTVPDYALAEFWFDVRDEQFNTPKTDLVQDPGTSECTDPNPWAVCGTVPPWDHEDRVSHTDLVASNQPFLSERKSYRVIERAGSGATLDAYATTWVCRNVDPDACSPEVAASVDDPFTLAACDPVEPPARCEAEGWIDGELSGEGVVTDSFDVCMAGHVVCKFTNTSQECPVLETTVCDLHALGGVENEPVGFATAAVPLRSGDTVDSIFLASFIPLSEGSRWPGDLDHFIQPLPVKENGEGQLVPDTSVTCVDAEDTGCLAWRAGTEILGQAPAASEVATDRRIGLSENERRVTYTTDLGIGVPRTIRAFDWSDSDAIEQEYDLWDGFKIPYIAGDTASEANARSLARSTINETLRIHEQTIVHPDLPTGSIDLDFVAGDFFHSDPVVVAAPANFFYLANDLEGNGAACDNTTTPNIGYRCFFEKNQRRRRLIVAAANDGQVHAFDAGQFDGEVVSLRLDGEFSIGTGKEVFAHITRPMLEHTQKMTADEHHFGVDGGLVVDDVFIDAAHNGTPDSAQREWRTVIFGTYRDGQRGVFALDVTQPDPVEKLNVLNFAGQPDIAWVPDDTVGVVPACAALGGAPGSGCGTLSYPAQLWEFDDTCLVTDGSGIESLSSCDEDSNGQPDLGFSWSQVNTGRILVNVQGEDDPVVKFVAIFGGGLDSDDKVNVGNWIYMVDVETGKAIYKRPVASAVPSEPAAVDTDQDGIIDTLYFGTAGGLLYKVDVSTPADVNPATGRIDTTSQWSPFPIFDTGGRAIFYPPTVTFVASQSKYALAFGTGDREDLCLPPQPVQDGRFYMILDPGFRPGVGPLSGGPLTEASFQQIDVFSPGALTADFLTAPLTGNHPGWVLRLAPNERVVAKALLLSGLLVFSTFNPLSPDVCEFAGNGSVYALLATNANSIAGPDEDRAITVDGFAGRAVVTPTGMTATGPGGEQIDPFAAARIQGIRDNLQDLMPADCRFGSFNLNVSVTMSNTSVMSVASVPICIVRKNWTEHF